MNWTTIRGVATAVVAGMTVFGGWPVHAETNRVVLPADVDALVHYTTVRRGNVTEHIKTTKAAIDAMKSGRPAPLGTHFVLADYRDGKLYRYFVMEKGAGFGDDYDESRRTSNWQFQWFWADGSINLKENTERCQSCHRSQADVEYLFTADRIPAFTGRAVD